MDKSTFALGKTNFIWIGIALLVITIGYLLMSGGGSTDGVSFNSDIFSARRIKVAPFVTWIGYLLMIYAVLVPDKSKREKEENTATK